MLVVSLKIIYVDMEVPNTQFHDIQIILKSREMRKRLVTTWQLLMIKPTALQPQLEGQIPKLFSPYITRNKLSQLYR